MTSQSMLNGKLRSEVNKGTQWAHTYWMGQSLLIVWPSRGHASLIQQRRKGYICEISSELSHLSLVFISLTQPSLILSLKPSLSLFFRPPSNLETHRSFHRPLQVSGWTSSGTCKPSTGVHQNDEYHSRNRSPSSQPPSNPDLRLKFNRDLQTFKPSTHNFPKSWTLTQTLTWTLSRNLANDEP